MLCSTVYLLFEKGPGCVCVWRGGGGPHSISQILSKSQITNPVFPA